jgi:hypothetical protein
MEGLLYLFKVCIVTCWGCACYLYGGFSIGWLDLLTPYSHDSGLQVIRRYLWSTHALGFSVFTRRILALPRMLDLWSSHRTVFVETASSEWIFNSAAVVLWFFGKILLSLRRSLCVSVNFRSLFLFVDAVFPWFAYADITLETGALDTPNNVTLFLTDVPAKRAPTICPLSKSDKSPIYRFFHTECHETQ